MRLHILGICGTFMGGIAILAKQSGHEVTGSDSHVYPPMSLQLREQGIRLMEGYDPSHITHHVDCVIVGNVIKRGNPAIEYILNQGIPYQSGPEWLTQQVLKNRWVLGVAGTHGKTTTTSLLAWILENAGFTPGFLVGGIPENFGVSARLGHDPYFVIESDEYDSAFFDKRSKFIHYRPKTLILNNLEYDHADIFPDLNSIKQQFHYLVRTIPGNGLVIHYAEDDHLVDVLKQGCWSSTQTFGQAHGDWQARLHVADGSQFTVIYKGVTLGRVHWNLLGIHNVNNALAALAAAHHVNISPEKAFFALSTFKNVKRRLEIKGKINGIVVYDDFAHHPTAIATTLAGLRTNIGKTARIIAVVEFGSYTMRIGVHKEKIQEALSAADIVFCKNTEVDWGLKSVLEGFKQRTAVYDNVDCLVNDLSLALKSGDHVVIMSNSGFNGIHEKLLFRLGVYETN
ncbi:MAG: UDP-N-acetylmuramate:L-alanyl-gamma-D-glutamyl-meso-diaminopimelate ligase [Gammaproteobacteria bacterium RIFCSPHIGHO2_12_FULL_37_34]|nr:MAG: UDP-N-acetylmuramate:L-alanyl-gamma-D-glutamyl-meso-diaminopimelate ligase [Gammaproteobacteria bacterium RIFCSPHIGHO2_12_FULL_37_34]